jgi:hypothetical protein
MPMRLRNVKFRLPNAVEVEVAVEAQGLPQLPRQVVVETPEARIMPQQDRLRRGSTKLI